MNEKFISWQEFCDFGNKMKRNEEIKSLLQQQRNYETLKEDICNRQREITQRLYELIAEEHEDPLPILRKLLLHSITPEKVLFQFHSFHLYLALSEVVFLWAILTLYKLLTIVYDSSI